MHIGVIGCGQLARLMALAGKKMGIQFSFVAIDDEPTSCVEGLGSIVHWQASQGGSLLAQALDFPDVITVEREDIDARLLFEVSMDVKVYPSPEIVATCQNRLKEKMALTKLNIPSTPWLSVTDPASARKAAETLGFPLIIKSLEQGYDGKNQWQIVSSQALDELLEQTTIINWIVEPKIDFIKEVSLIGVRSESGENKFYPFTENVHHKGILRTSIAPDSNIKDEISAEIKKNLASLLDSWQYVGVITMELFILADGFMVNELAPRVHNSGHWTDNDKMISQFENHVRAILAMPLGSTDFEGFAGMVNILGTNNENSIASTLEGKLHWYNKSFKPNRKLGHINLSDFSRDSLLDKLMKTEKTLYNLP